MFLEGAGCTCWTLFRMASHASGFPTCNDNAEIAELIACGSHVILFTTERGSVVGSAISLVIKICANPDKRVKSLYEFVKEPYFFRLIFRLIDRFQKMLLVGNDISCSSVLAVLQQSAKQSSGLSAWLAQLTSRSRARQRSPTRNAAAL
jgi:D-galactarate dehydratase / Altronate hydrolase, C terminus